MTFGYECEYFLLRDGQLFMPVPPIFDRDASQNLVEVRSNYYSIPRFTEQSFMERRALLQERVKREGLELAAVDRTPNDTAGFHLHFGYNGRLDMPKLILALDSTFWPEIRDSLRSKFEYRMKPYGFEYRSLPSSVDPKKVTKFLERYFA